MRGPQRALLRQAPQGPPARRSSAMPPANRRSSAKATPVPTQTRTINKAAFLPSTPCAFCPSGGLTSPGRARKTAIAAIEPSPGGRSPRARRSARSESARKAATPTIAAAAPPRDEVSNSCAERGKRRQGEPGNSRRARHGCSEEERIPEREHDREPVPVVDRVAEAGMRRWKERLRSTGRDDVREEAACQRAGRDGDDAERDPVGDPRAVNRRCRHRCEREDPHIERGAVELGEGLLRASRPRRRGDAKAANPASRAPAVRAACDGLRTGPRPNKTTRATARSPRSRGSVELRVRTCRRRSRARRREPRRAAEPNPVPGGNTRRSSRALARRCRVGAALLMWSHDAAAKGKPPKPKTSRQSPSIARAYPPPRTEFRGLRGPAKDEAASTGASHDHPRGRPERRAARPGGNLVGLRRASEPAPPNTRDSSARRRRRLGDRGSPRAPLRVFGPRPTAGTARRARRHHCGAAVAAARNRH